MDVIQFLVTLLYRDEARKRMRQLIKGSNLIDRPSVFYPQNLLYLIWVSLRFENSPNEPHRLLGNLINQDEPPRRCPLSVRHIGGLNSSKTTNHPRRPSDTHLQDMNDFASCLVAPTDTEWELYTNHFKGSMIKFRTKEDLAKNIEHLEQGRRDRFHNVFYRAWEDRYYFMGVDGTHHLAAVYRQCGEQDIDYELSAQVTCEKLNEDVIARINTSYLALLATHSDLWPLHELFRRCQINYQHVFLDQLSVGVTFVSIRDARRIGILDPLHESRVDSPLWLNKYLAAQLDKQNLSRISQYARRSS